MAQKPPGCSLPNFQKGRFGPGYTSIWSFPFHPPTSPPPVFPSSQWEVNKKSQADNSLTIQAFPPSHTHTHIHRHFYVHLPCSIVTDRESLSSPLDSQTYFNSKNLSSNKALYGRKSNIWSRITCFLVKTSRASGTLFFTLGTMGYLK